MWLDELVIRSLVSLWFWVRKLLGGPENTPATTSDDGATNAIESKFSTANRTEAAISRDPFLELRSRATKAGALAGLVGAILGLCGFGAILDFNTSQPGPGGDSQIALIGAALCITPYPLIGVAIGALIGRLGVRNNDDPKNETVVFRYGIVGGGIIGFVIGVLPYLLIWILIFRE